MLHVSRLPSGPRKAEVNMGNAAVIEELTSRSELNELYRLDASESAPEDEPADDQDQDQDDEDGAGEGAQPEGMPHPVEPEGMPHPVKPEGMPHP
jgi:hypothetical protein